MSEWMCIVTSILNSSIHCWRIIAIYMHRITPPYIYLKMFFRHFIVERNLNKWVRKMVLLFSPWSEWWVHFACIITAEKASLQRGEDFPFVCELLHKIIPICIGCFSHAYTPCVRQSFGRGKICALSTQWPYSTSDEHSMQKCVRWTNRKNQY